MIEYLRTYKEAFVDYKLSEAQILQYLHNQFVSDPKRFYRTKVVPAFNNYARAKVFWIRNYSSIRRQICMRQYLSGLSLKRIMEKESYDTSKALERLREKITTYATQGPVPFCTKEAKF